MPMARTSCSESEKLINKTQEFLAKSSPIRLMIEQVNLTAHLEATRPWLTDRQFRRRHKNKVGHGTDQGKPVNSLKDVLIKTHFNLVSYAEISPPGTVCRRRQLKTERNLAVIFFSHSSFRMLRGHLLEINGILVFLPVFGMTHRFTLSLIKF